MFLGPEFYILLVLSINLIKFIYVSVMNWYLKKTVPFMEEYNAITKLDHLFKFLPARYRPKKDISNLINDMHTSARLVGALRNEIGDKEEDIDVDGLQLKVVEAAEAKKRKKLKYKRKKKLGYSDEEAKIDSSDEEEEFNKKMEASEKEVVITQDIDKLKRKNVAMLRIPFDIKVNSNFMRVFVYSSVFVFFVVFLAMASLVNTYNVSQEVISFGSMTSVFTITSNGVAFFAFICDLKELYYTLKNVVPARQVYIPYLTLVFLFSIQTSTVVSINFHRFFFPAGSIAGQ